MLKKIGSFLLIALMIMAIFTPITISAATGGQCGDNLIWVLDDAGTLTIAGTGDMWNWEIGSAPWYSFNSPINRVVINHGVASIGNWAFYYCNNITTISIPQSVISIGDCAFYACKSLTTISIPASVTSIGVEAFAFCDSLVAVFVDENNLNYCDINGVLFSKDKKTILYYPDGKRETAYAIPKGVTVIGECAFLSCEKLTTISIPESVISIGNNAFYSCDSLMAISIPESVINIGDYAFNGCKSITTISIPSSVTYIGEDAFGFCDSLVAIFVDENNLIYCDINGVLFSKDRTGILCYPTGKGDLYYTIPEGVTNIGNYAFSASKLMTIDIPEGVTNIGNHAFNVSKLMTINIPSSVTMIGDWALSGCNNLKTINIPLSVTIIGDCAFSFCENLTTISISSSATSIGRNALYYCNRLADVYFGGSEEKWVPIGKGAGVSDTAKIHYNMPAPPGTIIGSALRTDITAEINGHAIPSFNVDGYTYIVAEELKYYGFSVYYDNATRTLALSRDTAKTDITRSYVKPYVAPGEVGIKEHDLVATDIVTYIDNNYTQSYNINGQTIIKFDELGRYGVVSFEDSTRIISVTIPGLN